MRTLLAILLTVCGPVSAADLDRQSAANIDTTTFAAYQPFDATTTNYTVGSVLFRTDSREVEQPVWPILINAATIAVRHPDLVIELEAHADVRGTRNHNHTLSSQRAHAVADFLVKRGVQRDRIRIHAFGEQRASANVLDSAAQLFDRRVTILLRAAEQRV